MEAFEKNTPRKCFEQQQYSVLKIVFRRGDPVPKFHYEVRSYSKVVVCSDLTDSELEFTCVQGINLNVSKDAHTYCRYVFHFTMDHIFNK